MQANHHKPLQTTTNISWDDGYSCAGKKQLFCLAHGVGEARCLLVKHDAFANTHNSKSCKFTMYQWWFVVIWGGLPGRQTTTNHYRNAVNMQNLGRCVFMCRWIGCRGCFVWCAMFHGDICTVSINTWGLNRYGHFNDVILNWHQVYSIGGATHTQS